MMDIKEEYQKKYGESLRDAIKGDTSGELLKLYAQFKTINFIDASQVITNMHFMS